MGWGGIVALGLLLLQCQASRPARLEAQIPSRLDKEYPYAFCYPPEGAVGVGFSPLGRYSRDPSLAQAEAMACTLLAWSNRVRVKGERLFEQTPAGELEYGGERIELLEVPPITPEVCRLETLEVARHIWIFAVAGEGSPSKGTALFSPEAPPWISQVPVSDDWVYAVGTAELSFKDEPGSWELATYRALVELAFTVTRQGALDKIAEGIAEGAISQEVDTVVEGFRVAARWRDQRQVYVLGKAPASKVKSHLK